MLKIKIWPQVPLPNFLPHPERAAPEVRRLQPDSEVEAIAMRVVMEYEKVDHYYLSIDAVTQPMEIRGEHGDFGK